MSDTPPVSYYDLPRETDTESVEVEIAHNISTPAGDVWRFYLCAKVDDCDNVEWTYAELLCPKTDAPLRDPLPGFYLSSFLALLQQADCEYEAEQAARRQAEADRESANEPRYYED